MWIRSPWVGSELFVKCTGYEATLKGTIRSSPVSGTSQSGSMARSSRKALEGRVGGERGREGERTRLWRTTLQGYTGFMCGEREPLHVLHTHTRMRKQKIPIPSRLMPTFRHFLRRQYWHWLRWCWSIGQFLLARHVYVRFRRTLRLKKLLQPSHVNWP